MPVLIAEKCFSTQEDMKLKLELDNLHLILSNGIISIYGADANSTLPLLPADVKTNFKTLLLHQGPHQYGLDTSIFLT